MGEGMKNSRGPKGGAALLAALLTCAASAALASTVVALDLGQLARGADEVVVAEVVSARGEPARGTIVTRLVVRVDQAVAGRARATDELEVITAGGEHNGIGVLVHGAPRLTVGARYLMFLSRRSHEHTVVGMAQGAMRVRAPDSSGTAMVEPPADLPRLVRRTGAGGLTSGTAAIVAPTPLADVIARVREARRGL